MTVTPDAELACSERPPAARTIATPRATSTGSGSKKTAAASSSPVASARRSHAIDPVRRESRTGGSSVAATAMLGAQSPGDRLGVKPANDPTTPCRTETGPTMTGWHHKLVADKPITVRGPAVRPRDIATRHLGTDRHRTRPTVHEVRGAVDWNNQPPHTRHSPLNGGFFPTDLFVGLASPSAAIITGSARTSVSVTNWPPAPFPPRPQHAAEQLRHVRPPETGGRQRQRTKPINGSHPNPPSSEVSSFKTKNRPDPETLPGHDLGVADASRAQAAPSLGESVLLGRALADPAGQDDRECPPCHWRSGRRHDENRPIPTRRTRPLRGSRPPRWGPHLPQIASYLPSSRTRSPG